LAPSSEASRVWGGRPVAWLSAAILGVIAIAAGYVAVTQSGNRVFNLCVAAIAAVCALMLAASTRTRGQRWERVDLDGVPAWALSLTGAGSVPTVALVCTTFGVAFGVGALSADSPGLAVVLGLLGLLMLVVGAEMWRVWARRPALTVTADRILLRGPGIDAELGWDDVGTVDYQALGTRWAAVLVSAATNATTYHYRLRRFLLPTDRVPDPPGIAVRVGLVPDAPALLNLLRAMHTGGRSGRDAMIGRGLPADSAW
jgi:hypothetical protein